MRTDTSQRRTRERGHASERSARATGRRRVDAPRARQPRRNGTGKPAARSAPQTTPTELFTRAKNTSQAKARAKARKAKAPKVVRPPLRQRLIARLSAVELHPRALVAKVPFVVLVIGSLAIGLGLTLWLSTDSAERSYQLGSARETNKALVQQKDALERDVLGAQSAPSLAEAARNLGMIPSRDTAHLVQDPAGNWVVVGTPKPADGTPPPPLNTPLPPEKPPTPPVNPIEVPVRVPPPAQALGTPIPAVGVPTPAPTGERPEVLVRTPAPAATYPSAPIPGEQPVAIPPAGSVPTDAVPATPPSPPATAPVPGAPEVAGPPPVSAQAPAESPQPINMPAAPTGDQRATPEPQMPGPAA
jgi:hypothetical protein